MELLFLSVLDSVISPINWFGVSASDEQLFMPGLIPTPAINWSVATRTVQRVEFPTMAPRNGTRALRQSHF